MTDKVDYVRIFVPGVDKDRRDGFVNDADKIQEAGGVLPSGECDICLPIRPGEKGLNREEGMVNLLGERPTLPFLQFL